MKTHLEARRAIKTSVNGLVDVAIQSVKEFHELRGAIIQVEATGSFEAVLIPQTIHTALVNLILNAAEARNHANILVCISAKPGNNNILIEVHDDGPGIPKHLWSTIFNPNFTTKVFNSGMGLLAVKAAAFVHNGSIEVSDSTRLRGACFRLTLPLTGTANSITGTANSKNHAI